VNCPGQDFHPLERGLWREARYEKKVINRTPLWSFMR
jgi:hypothetical protein